MLNEHERQNKQFMGLLLKRLLFTWLDQSIEQSGKVEGVTIFGGRQHDQSSLS